MLEFCVKQNVFLYAMIAAGIAGVWCLFWNNRFYVRAIHDLGRLGDPKTKWTRSVLENCQKKAYPFANAGAFMRSQMAQGRAAGIPIPVLLRTSRNMVFTVLALTVFSLWLVYRYQYGGEELLRYLGTGIAAAGGLIFLRLCLDFGGKEEILFNGWTDYLENDFAEKRREEQNVAQAEADCRVQNQELLNLQEAGVPSQTIQGQTVQGQTVQRQTTQGQTAPSQTVQGQTVQSQTMQNRTIQNAALQKQGAKNGELFSDPDKEERISKVREGIRQTAAAESRFAGMMTPEEEKLMREIIREYV